MKRIAEEHCEKIYPWLPVQRGNVRIPNIVFINALLGVAENGCEQRALPKRCGNWISVCARMRRRAGNGVLDRLFRASQELHPANASIACFGLDSASARCIRTARETGLGASANRAADGRENPRGRRKRPAGNDFRPVRRAGP